MYVKCDYYDNVLKLNEKEIPLNGKIVEVLCFEKCVIVRTKYSIAVPTNNLMSFDFYGNKLWEIDDIIKPMSPQTIVSIGKANLDELSVVTFKGMRLLIRVHTGELLKKEITK